MQKFFPCLLQLMQVVCQTRFLALKIAHYEPNQDSSHREHQRGGSGLRVLADIDRGMLQKKAPLPEEAGEVAGRDHAHERSEAKSKGGLQNGQEQQRDIGTIFVVHQLRKEDGQADIEQDRSPRQGSRNHSWDRPGAATHPQQFWNADQKNRCYAEQTQRRLIPIRGQGSVHEYKDEEKEQIQQDENCLLPFKGEQVQAG